MRNKMTFTLPLVGKSYEFTYSFESQSLEEDINLNSTEFNYSEDEIKKNQMNIRNSKTLVPEEVNINLIMQRDGEEVYVIKDNIAQDINPRSEEHTSELQSRFDLVC